MDLVKKYLEVRDFTIRLTVNLEIEDFCIQASPEVSPTKWHLGHTTWFFEELILKKFNPQYKEFSPLFFKIFNSYYKSLGEHWIQAERGRLSRPTVREIVSYRKYVDKEMRNLLEIMQNLELEKLLMLGLNHEQQHQELILMDIKYNFFRQDQNILYENFKSEASPAQESSFVKISGGLIQIGHQSSAFSYDNEIPSHKVYLNDCLIKKTLETNGEYLEFINSGGYSDPKYWFSDGYDFIKKNNIKSPLYWKYKDNYWSEFTLQGERNLDLNAPVSHINFYEASAYARYRGKRLPTEFEWEAAAKTDILGQDLHCKLWQWTSSDYAPYPGHIWEEGPLGEYNSKFMVNLRVLRGGSFATPVDHYRLTYRNYFSPEKRWMFSGIRLAGDCHE